MPNKKKKRKDLRIKHWFGNLPKELPQGTYNCVVSDSIELPHKDGGSVLVIEYERVADKPK